MNHQLLMQATQPEEHARVQALMITHPNLPQMLRAMVRCLPVRLMKPKEKIIAAGWEVCLLLPMGPENGMSQLKIWRDYQRCLPLPQWKLNNSPRQGHCAVASGWRVLHVQLQDPNYVTL